LASGIDTAAHEGALQAGPDQGSTVAILGTGIDIVYPARNRALAHDIAKHGALVSEFPLGTRAIPYQFPKRNRLVAGMSRGVLVVEAAKQSGSLITARLASEMGREVFAIPGSIHSPLSRGCHALIRQGAKLVESAEDIRDELGTPTRSPNPPSTTQGIAARQADAARAGARQAGPRQPGARKAGPQESMAFAAASPDDPVEFQILQALGYDPVALDTLHDRTRLDVATLGGRLLEMELQGLVVRQDDGRFVRR
jgi:DNA processing protein